MGRKEKKRFIWYCLIVGTRDCDVSVNRKRDNRATC